MPRRLLIVGASLILLLALAGGIIAARRINLSGTPPPTALPRIAEITLDRVHPEITDGDRNPAFSSTRSGLTTADRLALRVITDNTTSFTMKLRLLTTTGDIKDLEPSTVSFTPGQTGYCCWRISEPGTYTVQIFKPDGSLTTLPLTISPGRAPTP